MEIVMKIPNNKILAAIFTACTLWCNYSAAQNKAVSFTQDDRNRLIRVDERFYSLEIKVAKLEERINSLEDKIDYKFDALQIQINDIKTFMLWGFGILFSGMGFLIGFVMWDRRTTLAPVIKENQAIKRVFLKLAENNTDVKKALKEEGIL